MNNTPTVSYAQIIQKISFPTKEQAIIIDSVDGVTIHDYTVAIGRLIGPNNIRFASRISQGRVCLYLSSKEIADKLTDDHSKIIIGPHSLTIRPLITKAKRIILSNVCPIIPHEIILKELAKVNISPVSPISFIKAGIHEPGYSHILSFRRQLFINPEDINKVPPSLSFSYDDTVYWIYLSMEKLTCFLCKEEGHLAKFCNNAARASTEDNFTESDVNTPAYKKADDNNKGPSTVSQGEVTHDSNLSMPPPSRNKRALTQSTISSKDTPDTDDSIKKSTRREKPSKIQKTQSVTNSSANDISSLLLPAKDFILENTHGLPLNIDGITEFLVSSFGRHDIDALARSFTTDIPALINMLSEISSRLSSRKLRSRIHRIINRLSSPDTPCSSNEDLSSVEEFY